jgi:hypothetical protein
MTVEKYNTIQKYQKANWRRARLAQGERSPAVR